MRHVALSPRLLVAAGLVLLGLGSCFAERSGLTARGMGGATAGGGMPTLEGGMGGAEPVCNARPAKSGAKCVPVRSAEPLLSRVVVDEPQDVTMFVDDLYQQFKSNCGGCHIDGALGGFRVNGNVEFQAKVNDDVLKAIQSDTQTCEKDADGKKVDPDCFPFMPPVESNGKPWSERQASDSDAVRELATLIEVWRDYATPPPLDVFILPADKGGKTAYAIDDTFASSFTNLGTCVPDEGMVATELESSCGLDATFAALKKILDGAPHERLGLPRTLNETDLFTLDSAALAEHGVIGYAPTYPLWSDDAGKLRHVRVPRGESIKYNAETRQLDIPENTRFYKTFLKEVLTLSGETRFKKIETRIIVSRTGEGGQESLFGTYAWNDQETQATLVVDPLRNGEPFRDRLITVVTDEPKYQDIYARVEAGELRNLSYELEQAKAVRHYAIPGSERCVQCHMGSPSNSFILGFTPLQVNRRPCDQATLDKQGHCEGGILEPAGPDEVSQLERLISYGVITNFDPEKDLVKLEDPQGKRGKRPFRTPEELVAQGYLLGNCSHCHNPNGYPSVLNPELADLLDFLPSERGGVFGFPLDRFSPRIKRGPLGEISLPYITPSLRDILPEGGQRDGWAKKATVELDANNQAFEAFIDAPWRSLIYRNVDTPFTYTDDSTIYPHMPLNTPGFDCRAPKVMGDWMVSIPAKRKNAALSEEKPDYPGVKVSETDPQPFIEVKPDEPGYLNAQAEALKRLAKYRKGVRYQSYCPETGDIVDRDVDPEATSKLIPRDSVVTGMPIDGVPDRPHWVITDLTEVPGPWNPRRPDWKDIIVNQDFSAAEKELADPNVTDKAVKEAKLASEKNVVAMLQNVGLSDELDDFANRKIPFGLWMQNENCKFDSVPKLGDPEFQGEKRERWMDVVDGSHTQSDRPVYEAVPGVLIFNMICVNCHGPQADSKGRQASTLQEMTGGAGRVANFRDGFFGTFGSGGKNRESVFGSDDLARRYLAWMALGGTNTRIPTPILNLVAGTPVLGQKRMLGPGVVSSANMLQVAQALCIAVAKMGTANQPFNVDELSRPSQARFQGNYGLIETNGDAELWKELCGIDNPAPVRAFRIDEGLRLEQTSLFWPATYPTSTPVGDHRGHVPARLGSENRFPWCVLQPLPTNTAAVAFLSATKANDGKALPVCPPDFVVEANRFKTAYVEGQEKHVDVEKWALRGAVNAGLVVFSYLDWLVGKGNEPPAAFDQCEKL